MTSQSGSLYLSHYLLVLAPFLQRKDVSDIHINRPGELWLEVNGSGVERHSVPDLTRDTLSRLVRQIAAFSSQGISRENPILAAALPTGERVQIVVPPATRSEIAISIRMQTVSSLNLHELKPIESSSRCLSHPGSGNAHLLEEVDRAQIGDLLKKAVLERRTILISGGTSSGKTTLLNTLLKEIPSYERLIFIEDTPELDIWHENAVGLVSPRSALREANIDTDDLLAASLRMRPDRIILGELRGREAVTFLRAIQTGHPGSITTIHANTCESAMDQLAFLAIQGGLKLEWESLRNYIAQSIDISINIVRRHGVIHYSVLDAAIDRATK